MNHRLSRLASGAMLGVAAGAAGYASLVAWNRWRYGSPSALPNDPVLNRFMPSPEVAEHHEIAIAAPAAVVLAAAKEMQALELPLVRTVFKLRELALGGEPDRRQHPQGLLDQMVSIGWVVLDEIAEREIVLGAVTRPWDAAPVFRSIPAAAFASFAEPGYVKIVWTLRADPIDGAHSTFSTDTLVATTDPEARRRFRRYWSYVAPGVELIRVAMLRPLKREAERRAGKMAA
jgi:hypothetical protein